MEYVISSVGVGLSAMIAIGTFAWHAGRIRGRLDSYEQRIHALEKNNSRVFAKLDEISVLLGRMDERTSQLPCVRSAATPCILGEDK